MSLDYSSLNWYQTLNEKREKKVMGWKRLELSTSWLLKNYESYVLANCATAPIVNDLSLFIIYCKFTFKQKSKTLPIKRHRSCSIFLHYMFRVFQIFPSFITKTNPSFRYNFCPFHSFFFLWSIIILFIEFFLWLLSSIYPINWKKKLKSEKKG